MGLNSLLNRVRSFFFGVSEVKTVKTVDIVKKPPIKPQKRKITVKKPVSMPKKTKTTVKKPVSRPRKTKPAVKKQVSKPKKRITVKRTIYHKKPVKKEKLPVRMPEPWSKVDKYKKIKRGFY